PGSVNTIGADACGRRNLEQGGWMINADAAPGGRGKFLLTLALALAVSGCSVFRGPPPETYNLSAPESIEPGRRAIAAQILIPEPSALAALNTDRIVVTSGPRISYYPDAQWPDRLPKLLQAKAVEAFERSRQARAVGRPGEGLSIDYQLLIDIRSFAFVAGEGGGVAR